MGLITAARAFLEALDGPGTGPGHPQAPAGAPAPIAAAPLAELLGALAVRVSSLEASLEGMKNLVREEADRAERAGERTRRAVQRAVARVESGGELDDSDPDLPVGDVQPGPITPVQPVHGRVEVPTPEQIRAQARRAVALM